MPRKKHMMVWIFAIVALGVLLFLFLFPVKTNLRAEIANAQDFSAEQLSVALPNLVLSIAGEKGFRESIAFERGTWFLQKPLPHGNFQISLDLTEEKSISVSVPRSTILIRKKAPVVVFHLAPAVQVTDVRLILQDDGVLLQTDNSGWQKNPPLSVKLDGKEIPLENGILSWQDFDPYLHQESFLLEVFLKRSSGTDEKVFEKDFKNPRIRDVTSQTPDNDHVQFQIDLAEGFYVPQTLGILRDGQEILTQPFHEEPVLVPVSEFENLQGEESNPLEIPLDFQLRVAGRVIDTKKVPLSLWKYRVQLRFPFLLESIPLEELSLNIEAQQIVDWQQEDDTTLVFSVLSARRMEKMNLEVALLGQSYFKKGIAVDPFAPHVVVWLPGLVPIQNLKGTVGSDNDVTVSWSLEKVLEEGVAPQFYEIFQDDVLAATTTATSFSLAYSPQKMSIRVRPVYFGRIRGDSLEIEKPQLPRMVLEIPQEVYSSTIPIRFSGNASVSVTVEYLLQEYLVSGDSSTNAWLPLESEWQVIPGWAGKDLETGPAFSGDGEIPIPGILLERYPNDLLSIRGKIRMVDFWNQVVEYPFEVSRFSPPKVKFSRMRLIDQLLHVEWKKDSPESRDYESFFLSFLGESGFSKTFASTSTSLQIDLSQLPKENYSLILGSYWLPDKYVELDQMDFVFQSQDFSSFVDLALQQEEEQWKLTYTVKKNQGFQQIWFRISEKFGEETRVILENTSQHLNDSFSWPSRPGAIFQVESRVYFSYTNEYGIPVETVLSNEQSQQEPPNLGGILEAYQISDKGLRLVAYDDFPGIVYSWSIVTDDPMVNPNVYRIETTTHPKKDVYFNLAPGPLEGKITVTLFEKHVPTGATATHTVEIFTAQAEKYLFEDVPENVSMEWKGLRNAFLSRNIKVGRFGALKIADSTIFVAPGVGISTNFGELTLENARFTVLQVPNRDVFWGGIVAYAGKVNIKDSSLSGGKLLLDSFSADVKVSGTVFKQSIQGINIQKGSLDVGAYSVFDTLQLGVSVNQGELKIAETEMKNVARGVVLNYARDVSLENVWMENVSQSCISSRGVPSLKVVDSTFSGKEKRVSTAFDFRDSEVFFSDVEAEKLDVGLVLSNSEFSAERFSMRDVITGIHQEYSWMDLQECSITARNTGIRAITSPFAEPRVALDILDDEGKPLQYVAEVDNSLVSAGTLEAPGTAVEILRGNYSLLFRNSEIEGKTYGGGYYTSINGVPQKMGNVVIR